MRTISDSSRKTKKILHTVNEASIWFLPIPSLKYVKIELINHPHSANDAGVNWQEVKTYMVTNKEMKTQYRIYSNKCPGANEFKQVWPRRFNTGQRLFELKYTMKKIKLHFGLRR